MNALPKRQSRVEPGANETRAHCVSTRLNGEELAALQADATAQHKKMGAVLREAYFHGARPLVPVVNVEKWQALGNALEDLHLTALHLNAGRLPEDLRPQLAETMELVHALRSELVNQPKN